MIEVTTIIIIFMVLIMMIIEMMMIVLMIMMMIIIRERRPSCFDITRPTYNLLLTPVSNELAEKLPEDLQEWSKCFCWRSWLWWWWCCWWRWWRKNKVKIALQSMTLRWLWQLVSKIILILCRCQRRPTQIVALFQSFPTSWALVSLMRWQQIVLIKMWNQQIHFFMKLLFTSKASLFDSFRFQWKRWSRFLGKCTTAQKPRRFSSQGGFRFSAIIMIDDRGFLLD